MRKQLDWSPSERRSVEKRTTESLLEPDYADWIRKQPCHQCQSPLHIQGHHHTSGSPRKWEDDRSGLRDARGKSTKAHDSWLIPLCLRCHANFHAASGQFRDWDRAKRRAWQDDAVVTYRGMYLDAGAF